MNRLEAEQLLPWFVAGTLETAEAAAVQAFIDSGEIPRSQLEELALFADSVAETGAEEPAYNPAILTRAMAQLDQLEQARPDEPLVVREAHSEATANDSGSGIFANLLDRLQWSLQWNKTPPLARLAIGAQFALLLGLAVALGVGEGADEGLVDGQADYETVAGPVAATADLSVVFVPSAAETQIRKLLIDNQASIIAGPTALGIYTIDIADSADLQIASDNLSASPLTLLVQPAAQP